jgi:predicted alpha-1,2-mannosidase
MSTLLLAACGAAGTGGETDAAREPDAPDGPDAGRADAAVDATGSPTDAAGSSGPPDAAPDPPDARTAEPPPPVVDVDTALDDVDVFLGTAGVGFAYAALTPAAQMPVGMVSLGPDTSRGVVRPPFHHFSGYHFDDPDTLGFSHTHFIGTGVGDFGNFRFLPVAGDAEAVSTARQAPAALFTRFTALDKTSERGAPGHYGVRLPEVGVDVELTATVRGGLQRYTFDGPGPVAVFFHPTSDAAGEGGARFGRTEPSADGVVSEILFGASYTGRNPFRMWADVALDPPPSEIVLVGPDGAADAEATRIEGVPSGALLVWDALPADRPVVEVRTGISWVDAAQARANRVEELDGRAFETVRDAARDAWADKLRRVRVGGGTPEQRRILATSVYNAYRMPTTLSGVDGRYPGFDQAVHTAEDFVYFSNLSLWDTFRTLHPWYSLVDPDLQRDCLRSLLAMGEQGGYIPRWPAGIGYSNGMIGTSADVVFADAAVKGVDGVDYAAAFERLKLTADGPVTPGHRFSGREGIEAYLEFEYMPEEATDDSVSKALEYANNDNALAHLAAYLGRESDAERYRARAGWWRNHFDAASGFMYPRGRDGAFRPVSARNHAEPYTEGTAWQWTFFVPQDPAGLAAAFGGPVPFGEALETFFVRSKLGSTAGPVRNTFPDSYYWHGNEPDIHAAYLFAWSDRPDRGHYWLREIQTRLYADAPDGLAGNDDGGTLSTWYVFGALGLYPIAGTPDYMLGAPLFPRAEVALPGGATLTVLAPGASVDRRYVRSVTFDGVPVVGPTVPHSTLSGGGTLAFEMAADPGR